MQTQTVINTPYATLSPRGASQFANKGNTDSFALILPRECSSTLREHQDVENEYVANIEVKIGMDGSAIWKDAQGNTRQIGSPEAPLPKQIIEAMQSDDGVITFFLDDTNAQITEFAIFYAAKNSQ